MMMQFQQHISVRCIKFILLSDTYLHFGGVNMSAQTSSFLEKTAFKIRVKLKQKRQFASLSFFHYITITYLTMQHTVPHLTDSNHTSANASQEERYEGCCAGLLQHALQCGYKSKHNHFCLNLLQKWPYYFSLILYILHSFYIFTIRHDSKSVIYKYKFSFVFWFWFSSFFHFILNCILFYFFFATQPSSMIIASKAVGHIFVALKYHAVL